MAATGPHRMSRIERERSVDRDALVARWTKLTRDVLPGMAAAERWPIHLDHCFMRVCLDAALGAPWTSAVARPAIRTMNDRQLAQAVAVAEGIAAAPETLDALNRRSVAARRPRRSDGVEIGPNGEARPEGRP